MNRRVMLTVFAALIAFTSGTMYAQEAQFKQQIVCFTPAGNENVLITARFSLSANQIVGPGSIHVDLTTDYAERCPSAFTPGEIYGLDSGFCITYENGSPVGGDLMTFFNFDPNPFGIPGYQSRCGGVLLTVPEAHGSFDVRITPGLGPDSIPNRVLFDFGFSCDSLVQGGFGGGWVCSYTHVTVPVQLSPVEPPPPPPPTQAIRVGAALSGGAPETANPANGPVTAHVPLGAEFQLWLQDATGSHINATYRLGADPPDAGVAATALLPNTIALLYTATTSPQQADFQAVHRGTVALTITPDDQALQAVTCNVQVEAPASLGTTNGTWDQNIINFAHQRGIPPQVIKGQISRESNFVQRTWRYEPITVDYQSISRRGHNQPLAVGLIGTAPYNRYALGADRAHSSADLVDDDIAPREEGAFPLQIRDSQTGRLRDLTLLDPNPTARQLIESNARQNWTAVNNLRDPQLRQDWAQHPEWFEFAAQTPTAASWGLMHILYSTAIVPMGWQGENGRSNPSLLFDPNVAIRLGTGYFNLTYRRANATRNAPNSPEESRDQLTRALNLYNHSCLGNPRRQGSTDTCSTDSYGTDSLSRGANYQPIPAGRIFP